MSDLPQGTGLSQAAAEVLGLINKFIEPAMAEGGAILGDHVRFFRLKQQTKLLRRAVDILKRDGLTPKAVNLRVLLPLLEAGALEEEEQMAERWASLLASAGDPRNSASMEASFVEILKQLAPTHAYLLDVFYAQIQRYALTPDEFPEKGAVLSDLKSFLSKEVPDFDIALDNLLRLRLVSYPMVKLGVANGNAISCPIVSSNILCATQLGQAFVIACGRGRTPTSTSYGVPSNSVSNVFWTQGGSVRLWSKEEEAAWARRK